MISSRAIRKGITIKFDGKIVDKPVVIEASKTWEPKHETLFMKLLKTGW
jgi:translation elongation factor P/translation initiation factor 5A